MHDCVDLFGSERLRVNRWAQIWPKAITMAGLLAWERANVTDKAQLKLVKELAAGELFSGQRIAR